MRLLIADGSMYASSAARAICGCRARLRTSAAFSGRCRAWPAPTHIPNGRLRRALPKYRFKDSAGMSKVRTTRHLTTARQMETAMPSSPRTSPSAKSVFARRPAKHPEHSSDRTQDRMDRRSVRRQGSAKSKSARAGAPPAATGRHRPTRRLREDAAGPRRLGARAESERRRARHRNPRRPAVVPLSATTNVASRTCARRPMKSSRKWSGASVPRAMPPARRR